ncbi:MAG: NCS2 family permease [Deltaproteobacteria bacterium]|nr:NCS2 family permease [Deltaproteobacteria bacterium]
MRWFTRGDLDGFFGLALDNLVQLLLIDALCRYVLGMSPELLYGRVLPGAAMSLLVGNAFYAWQAMQLAKKTGRTDVCALPYGINTVSLFAHVFLIMLPAKLAAEAAGHPDPVRVGWQAGLVATLASGAIELVGAAVAEKIRKATPRAALLSTLSGIALGFISLGFLFRTFAHPIVGLASLGVVLLTYFGRVKFKGSLPGGAVAIALGTLLAWATGLAPNGPAPSTAGLHLPVPVIGDVIDSLTGGHMLTYLSVIVPMGLFNVLGSLQNIESAEAAGDLYPTGPSLAVNGIGSLVAGLFGSAFPTTIYIGHPGWKALGARAGYSVLNGLFATIVCLTGTLGLIAWAVPIDAGMAIVLWIGLVITAQAFQAVPREEAPAVVVGILPAVAAWGALLAKNGMRAAGLGAPGKPFSDGVIAAFERSDTWITGAFALEQGFIFSAMCLSACTVEIIKKRFRHAGLWCLGAAAASALGLCHSWAFTPGDTTFVLAPAWPHAAGYTAMALLLFLAPWLTEDSVGH